MVSMVFNDLTSKPKLSIFWLTIAITWNIYALLLLPNTFSNNSSTYLGVKFCGVSYLEASFDGFLCPLFVNLDPYPTPTPLLILVHSMVTLW
jgi:hypothetical protein